MEKKRATQRVKAPVRLFCLACLTWCALGLVFGCGGSSDTAFGPPPDFDKSTTVVHDGTGAFVCTNTSATGCEGLSGKHCPDGKGPAEVFVSEGKVVHAVCYKTPKRQLVVKSGDQKLDENDVLVTFETKPHTYNGSLDIKGDRATILGHGLNTTAVNGNVKLDGKDCRLRGVKITGSLKLHGDRCAAIAVMVLGNVEVDGDDVVLSKVLILGNLQVKGERFVASSVYLQGKADLEKKATCVESKSFQDRNESGFPEASELDGDWCK